MDIDDITNEYYYEVCNLRGGLVMKKEVFLAKYERISAQIKILEK